MDKELKAMIDCEEIQSLIPWKVGTKTDKGFVTYASEQTILYDKVQIASADGMADWHETKDLLKIPDPVEDVGEWLRGTAWQIRSPEFSGHKTTYRAQYHTKGDGHAYPGEYFFKSDTELKARLMLYMWVEHGKRWNGRRWK